MSNKKIMTTMRLSEECRELIQQIAERMGVTQTAAIEYAVREVARGQGLLPESKVSEGDIRIVGQEELLQQLLELLRRNGWEQRTKNAGDQQ